MKFVTLVCSLLFCLPSFAQEKFPDGTLIPDWFRQNEIVNIETLGGKYKITDHGVVNDSTLLQTEKIQAVIDQTSSKGGGVIIIPKGTYLSGALFFKPKTHLYLEEGAVLKGSDDISNFPIINTRIEGQSLKYFAAHINRIGGRRVEKGIIVRICLIAQHRRRTRKYILRNQVFTDYYDGNTGRPYILLYAAP